MKSRKPLYYALLLLFLIAGAAVIYVTGNRVRLPYADEMEEASRLHVKVAEAVKEERLARGYALVPEDTLDGPVETNISALFCHDASIWGKDTKKKRNGQTSSQIIYRNPKATGCQWLRWRGLLSRQ